MLLKGQLLYIVLHKLYLVKNEELRLRVWREEGLNYFKVTEGNVNAHKIGVSTD